VFSIPFLSLPISGDSLPEIPSALSVPFLSLSVSGVTPYIKTCLKVTAYHFFLYLYLEWLPVLGRLHVDQELHVLLPHHVCQQTQITLESSYLISNNIYPANVIINLATWGTSNSYLHKNTMKNDTAIELSEKYAKGFIFIGRIKQVLIIFFNDSLWMFHLLYINSRDIKQSK